MTTYT